VGFASDYTPVRRAVDWLTSRQQADGGWGESGESYWPERKAKPFNTSTPSQTAWAVLGLMAAGEVHSDTVERGIRHLAETQNTDGSWSEEHYTAVGFPRVFYLRYHGYAQIFPVWALARYRVLTQGNRTTTQWGL